jgi:choline dehydrogenase-like flavoprotein
MSPTPTPSLAPQIADPVQAGIAAGWQVIDASTLGADRTIEADIAIIGTGAGGGVSAEILTLAGLSVVMIEEGPLKSSRDFKMREADAYPALYQESAARKSGDKAINILQGRSVGGSTTVNWTSSFRTPEQTLLYWEKNGLSGYSAAALQPWFEMMEQRLHISPWQTAPNENNDLLRRGAERLGIPTAAMRRNVRGCWNLGYCGTGCPTNAKQSMLVTTIPAALERGAMLLVRTRAERLHFRGDQVESLSCAALAPDGLTPSGVTLEIRARHYIVCGGAINTPALLLRSDAPDPHGVLGKRTFLHPTVISAAQFKQEVNGFDGAPQSVYSDHFLHTQPIDGPLGYKLETPPLHPVLFSTTMQGFGAQHATMMRQFAHAHALLALLRDGFSEQSVGGTVGLKPNGSPRLDYPLNRFFWDGVRRALLSMAEIQFAAGAKSVHPVHEKASGYDSWAAARAAIAALPFEPLQTRVVSAHVMGGCALSDDPRNGVVAGNGRHHQLANLSVHDGSLFPTSIGANPQLSIYGIAARLASGLAQDLTGKAAPIPRAGI